MKQLMYAQGCANYYFYLKLKRIIFPKNVNNDEQMKSISVIVLVIFQAKKAQKITD